MGLLRTILALAVVFAHTPWNAGYVFVGGRNAVQLFYMISGFLIAHIIRTNDAYRNPRRFYANRTLRIFPIYYAVAALTLLAAAVANPQFFALYKKAPLEADILLTLSNLFIFGQDWVLFSAVRDGQFEFTTNFHDSDFPVYQGLLVPQAWTLGVELTFYALAPFVLRQSTRLLLLLVLSLCIRLFLFVVGLGPFDPWSYRFFPAELSLFLLGAVSNIYLLPLAKARLEENRLPPWLPQAATFFMAATCIVYFLIPLGEHIKTPALFALFLVVLPMLFLHQGKTPLDGKIGELSYPIYIGHMLVISATTVALRKLSLGLGPGAISLLNAVLATGFAYLLNRWIGQPVERLRGTIRNEGHAGAGAVQASPQR